MFKLFASAIVFASFALLSIGCSSPSEGGNGGVSPLTDAQKARFTNTMEGLGRIENAGTTASKSGRPRTFSASIPSSNEKTTSDIAQKMQTCQIESQDGATGRSPSTPSSPSDFGNMKMKMKIYGPTCPVEALFQFDIDTQQVQGGMTMTMKMDMAFVVLDNQLKVQNGIESATLAFNMSSDMRSNGQDSASVTMSISGGGEAKSVLDGTIKFTMSGGGAITSNRNGASGAIPFVFRATYSDGLIVELKQVMAVANNQSVIKFYLNNQEITEQEYYRLMGSIGQRTKQGGTISSLN